MCRLGRGIILKRDMKLDSKYFDSIRVGEKRETEDAKPALPPCQWKGCTRPASHRAPKGRGRDGEYFNFCIDHVREYNASYNYFDGMSDAEVTDFQKDAVTGHRPTWKVGANSWAHGTRLGDRGLTGAASRWRDAVRDPHGLFGEDAGHGGGAPDGRRPLRPVERKSLEALDLAETATKSEIKARFKLLVKRHHPDANGGDTRSEDKLREIIQAYNYLKQAGLV